MKKPQIPSNEYYDISERDDGEIIVYLKGKLNVKNAATILKALASEVKTRSPSSLVVDIGQVSVFDDYGALILFELKHLLPVDGGLFRIENVSSKPEKILAQINFDEQEKCEIPQKKRAVNILVRLGNATIRHMDHTRYMISFIGSVVLSFIHVLFHPKALRVGDTVNAMEKIGVDALPIVALISFLLGLIIAFMSSIQLQQFGANIYVASLVALAMTSELGPIMTAIIVAGRSGSAFAAEIGTMKIYEEIAALFTMGFNPTLFLAVPKILASIIVVPLLTLFSNLFAIAGGLVVGVLMLGLTPGTYISQTIETLTLFDVMWGLTKSVIFAILIAWVGCLRGFQTRGGAAGVGNAATSAVVTSIFLIVLFDSIFAVIRSYWR